MQIQLLQLQTHGDDRGVLVALERGKNVPFEIKRVYYLFGTKTDVRRGYHSHKSLNQLVVAVIGSCRFLLDDGNERIELCLDNPSQGLVIGPRIWREIYDFSDDCVLMVLADQLYDENDYIRNYADFKAI